MTTKAPTEIHPRDVADKSSKKHLQDAIRMALAVESDALRHNTQTFNSARYKAVARLADYEELKRLVRQIKEDAIGRLPELIEMLTRSVQARGGRVFYAKTKEEAVAYITQVCQAHHARLVVKAKSITSEEIRLNAALEKAKIEVAETDLAEFILQVSGEQPSHNVAPAIHRSRERISQLFKEKFHTDLPLDTGEDLTRFARDILRKKFLAADVGISGANLLAAEEGAVLLVESEGNIRLVTHLPAVHIAVAGIEKIIPRKKEFGLFIELLAASATGQPLSTYTNILEPPLPLPILNLNGRNDRQREFHLVLIDNGRMAMREDPVLHEALYCMRCSACMNVCANFQAVGGHAFGGECYTGGIGAAWTVGTTGSLEAGRFAELCTGCSRCVPNCPVSIDIPALNTEIKSRLMERSGGPSLQKRFFAEFAPLARLASLVPRLANFMASFRPGKAIITRLVGLDPRRLVPPFAPQTLEQLYRKYRSRATSGSSEPQVILFADIFTNYTVPEAGMATVQVFERLGIPVGLSRSLDDGRAALSQGMVASATWRARKTAAYLGQLVDAGKDIIVAEPSVLAMFRRDYATLIDGALAWKLQAGTFDPAEYLLHALRSGKISVDRFAELLGSERPPIFYHGHCQLKTIGAGSAAPELLRALGFAVQTSTAECCGMAGSFGYKKEYYDISKNVGDDLLRQIDRATAADGSLVVLASGISCREQIGEEMPVMHPMEWLLRRIKI